MLEAKLISRVWVWRGFSKMVEVAQFFVCLFTDHPGDLILQQGLNYNWHNFGAFRLIGQLGRVQLRVFEPSYCLGIGPGHSRGVEKGVASASGVTHGSSHLIAPTCGIERVETDIQSVSVDNRSTLDWLLVLSLKFYNVYNIHCRLYLPTQYCQETNCWRHVLVRPKGHVGNTARMLKPKLSPGLRQQVLV